ncbi:hypothetical protein, conserved [Eimeria praecox]|uniref:J domain-containing protein n=1 Tax=Eimeria praecox TaxID=51316 RepID=U6H109_9EIME|nr:hypothetical protein, conserved [Eimeria praecox]
MKVDALPEQQPTAASSSMSSSGYCNSSSSSSICRSAVLPSDAAVGLPSSCSSKMTISSEAISSKACSSSSSCEGARAKCSKSAEDSSSKSSACSASSTEPTSSPPADAATADNTTSSSSISRVPPLSTYSSSPFSTRHSWFLRIGIAYKFIIGGFWGFPATASVLLLPQLLLRLFTLGGCGLLVLYDTVWGLRRTYSRLLVQQQQEWVQRMLLVLQRTEQQDTHKVLLSQRKRLQQLVAAMRRCLAAASSASDALGQETAAAGPAATAEASVAAAAAAEASIPHETEAAAQLAVAGDMQLAAVVFGGPREAIAAAYDAAQLLQAERTRQCKLQQQQQQTRTLVAAASAAFAAAGGFIWGTMKRAVVFVGCVLLMHLFIDIPAAASASAAAASNIRFSPWWLLLLHAAARGCFAAALMNQHASNYMGLSLCRSLVRSSKRSSSKNSSSNSSGIDFVPKPSNIHLRLFFAFCIPIVCSVAANAAAAAIVVDSAAVTEMQWGWRGVLLFPLALMQTALQQVLPFDVLMLLPLKRQRSEAAELLMLLKEQLSWSVLPEAEVLQEYFAAGTLLTAAAAAAVCCSKPSALWVARMRLESAAAASTAAQLLGLRADRLRQQRFSERFCSKCRWARSSVLLSFYRLPWGLVGCLRRVFVLFLGLSWLVLLLHAFLNTPLLPQSGEIERQTPLQLLQQHLQQQEAWEGLQQTWQEVLQLQREVGAHLEAKTYSESLEWLLLQLQVTWEEYLRTSSKQADDLQRARELFGLSEDASAASIKQRYRQLAKLHHPDRATLNSCINSSNSSSNNGGHATSCECGKSAADGHQSQCTSRQETMQQINLAYELLLQQAPDR